MKFYVPSSRVPDILISVYNDTRYLKSPLLIDNSMFSELPQRGHVITVLLKEAEKRFRSSRMEMSYEKDVLKNFVEIQRKTAVPEPLF